MKVLKNNDFFKKSVEGENCGLSGKQHTDDVKVCSSGVSGAKGNRIFASAAVVNLAKQASDILDKCGLHRMSKCVGQIISDSAKDRFTVSVVGEFSRGKSTLINKMLNDAAALPVANLPTTAVMTRIRYATNPKMAVFDGNGARVGIMDVASKSWENLVANNFGDEQPEGGVIVGVPDEWLLSNSIEMIDCPGAGDLSDERTKQIAATMERTNAAIICLTATAALGETEKEFIINRVLKQKTPFAMVVITKLDLVKLEDRNGIIEYVKNILKLNNINIPVYIPDVEMPDDKYDDIKGIAKIKSVISSWATAPQRQSLTDTWIKTRVQNVVFMALDTLKEQKKLFDADNEKIEEIIRNQKNKLDQMELVWGDLEIELQRKSDDCYNKFIDKVREFSHIAVERLQYEAGHTNMPEKWWLEDYPYRLKVELANMSVGLDNYTSRIIAEDAKWFNSVLDQKFRNFVQVDSTSVTSKENFVSEKSSREIEFEDLTRKQNIAKLGTTALCIASYFTPLGIIGSMGFGAGGTIMQQSFFKKKIEEQTKVLKEAIGKDVPSIIDKAIVKSEQRIMEIYDSILQQSAKKKDLWHEAQYTSIINDNQSPTADKQETLSDNMFELQKIKDQLN